MSVPLAEAPPETVRPANVGLAPVWMSCGSDSVIEPSPSSETLTWLVVPAIQDVRLDTDESTFEPLVAINRDAVRAPLVRFPVRLRPLVMSRLPANELEAVDWPVKVPVRV